jgi:RNA polymerase sigma-70 factor, ECF subfamily
MEPFPPDDVAGDFEARYLAFLATVTELRPRLHRYCARMTGSVFDGEDVVQEALFRAYRRLDTLEEGRPLAPWLFRIAHNRCIDFLRHRGVQEGAETGMGPPDAVEPPAVLGPDLDRALEHLVLTLPPKERASVLLKDVFDYSLEEIAELVDSTVGGVKSALNRGRTRLAAPAATPRPALRAADPETTRLVQLYVDGFNRRDWDTLRDLISADARIRVADRFAGTVAASPYFGNFERWGKPWRLAAGQLDGEPAVIILLRDGSGWRPESAVRLTLEGGRITRIADYVHCTWILAAAREMHLWQEADGSGAGGAYPGSIGGR